MNSNGTLTVTPVTNIETKQQQPTCRFSISASLDGFPITIEGEGKAGDLKTIVDRLKAIGASPPQAASKPAQRAGTPTCPTHNTPMKESQKPGTFFCPKRDEGGSYCKEKA